MKLVRLVTPRRLKTVFYLNLLVILGLTSYRAYLFFFEQDFESVHAEQIERIQASLADKDELRFAVVGNINNSIGLFERKMIPMLNQAGLDFVVSAGNAVSQGGEDKYRSLYQTMSRLQIPYLLTVGENETSTFGSFHFYRHFGPYFYSFQSGAYQFIFLDSTDVSAHAFQLRWLEDRLQDDGPRYRFVFLGHPLLQAQHESPLDFDGQYLESAAVRDELKTLFSRHGVTAVFSSNLHLYDRQQEDGVEYITTGGAGGLVLNNDVSFYHFVEVAVKEGAVSIDVRELDIGQHQVLKTLESLWLFIHSLFYVGHLNFLLILAIFIVLGIKLYTTVFVERNYYPNFDLDPKPFRNRPLRVAMFTNNYLPFISGISISIERLRDGLQRLHHLILIVAPSYRDQRDPKDKEGPLIRVPSLLKFGSKGEFRMANMFSLRIGRALRRFKPDLIHTHHPFWLGWIALIWARRLKVPVVYTYHTRLEHYAHFIPLPGSLFRNLISHSIVRHFANRCGGVIVPTGLTEEYLRVIGVTTNLYVQPTGIDFERFQLRSEPIKQQLKVRYGLTHERVFISVSRLSREKNINFIIEGLALLKRQSRTPFKCLLIGEGDGRSELEALIEERGMSDCIHLVGAIEPDEVVHYYQLGDAFLFASKSETQGIVVLEAMAARLPVVAVRSSGIDDFVRDGYNGYKTSGDITQWTARVTEILEDEALRKTLADHALEFSREYAIDRFAANVEEIYAHVLASYHDRKSG